MATTDLHDTIIILDYGSQYSQLIARRVREANVFCRIESWRTAGSEIMAYSPKGFILSGGPNSVYDTDAPSLPAYVIESGLPVFGICYGMQLLTQRFGGNVARSKKREYGPATLIVDDLEDPLFQGWNTNTDNSNNSLEKQNFQEVWMSHGDRVERMGPNFSPIGHTENSPYAVAVDQSRKYYMVQFHPEVAHTPQGSQLINNFLTRICHCRQDWTPGRFIEEEIKTLRQVIKKEKVVLGISGGVDSAVTGTLISRAIGDQLTGIFVNSGLLRKGEPEKVVQTFKREQGMNLIAVDATEDFLGALSGILDPEEKRRVIGEKFIRIFEKEAKKFGGITYLAQGTIYPDVIESASRDRPEAQTIKTHHNVGGLPSDITFKLIEPIRMLFKDEVRQIAKQLGLPDSIIFRQPFPGPGLAIRCLGEVTWERLERLRNADEIFLEELERENFLQETTQQAFAVLLPVKSVGVMGDGRSYQEVVALRAVTTEDFMTADWARLPDSLLARVSRRIVNEVEGINRVVYDITSKPPGTIEWE